MKLRLVPMLALASGLALATAACGGKGDNNDNPGGANPTATSPDTGAPAATTTSAMAGAATANDHAAQFLTDAIKGDNGEIRFGHAAIDMGQSQGVKDFGKMLVADHTKHKDQAVQIAKAMNVPVPDGTTPESDSAYKMTTSMSGAGFDKDFISAMIDDHKKDIDKFQQEAASSDPAQVTDFAKQSLPTLKKHLQTAESLQKK